MSIPTQEESDLEESSNFSQESSDDQSDPQKEKSQRAKKPPFVPEHAHSTISMSKDEWEIFFRSYISHMATKAYAKRFGIPGVSKDAITRPLAAKLAVLRFSPQALWDDAQRPMTCTDYLTHPNKSHIASQQRSHHSERANPPPSQDKASAHASAAGTDPAPVTEVFAAAPAVQDAMVAGGDLSQIVAAGLAANLSRATQTLVVPPPATTLLLGGAAPHPGGWCARELWARLTMPLIGSGMVPNIPQVDMGPIWPVSSLLRDQGPPSPLLAVQPAQGEADSLVMGGLDIASVRYAALGGLIHLGAPSGGHEVAFPQYRPDRGWLARATVVLLLPRVLLEGLPPWHAASAGDPASPPSTQPSSSPPTSEAPAQEPKTQVRTPPRTGPDMIWVGGLPSSCAHPDLVAGLAKSSLHVLAARRPRGARGPRPYAFVQLASHDEAVRAVQLGTIDICGARVVLRKIRMGRQQQATAHRAVAPQLAHQPPPASEWHSQQHQPRRRRPGPPPGFDSVATRNGSAQTAAPAPVIVYTNPPAVARRRPRRHRPAAAADPVIFAHARVLTGRPSKWPSLWSSATSRRTWTGSRGPGDPSIPGNQLADRLAEAARLGGPPDRGGIQATFPTQELCGPIGPAQWPSGPAESPLPFSHKFLTRSLLTTLARLAHEEEEARDWLACPYAYHPLEPISARVSNTWWTRRGEPLSTVRKLCAAKCQAFWGVNQRHDQVLRALARALTAAGLKVVVHDSAANARKATQIPEELQARIPAHLRHLRPDLLLAVTTAVRDEDLAKARDGKLAQYRGYCQAAGFDNRALLFGATGCIPGQSVRDLLQLVPGTEHKTLCEALRRISGDLTRSILALFLMRDSDRRDRASTQIHRPAAAPSGFLHPPLRHLHGSP
ncbi:hypothetical protein PAPYR_9533 [Paratrimastix pyriformis]|uniref:RRM domain-containing protein n=1 Tax=Paratrimastix pyriformis TaxID=342808 RepID=A0ABQ8UF99_9EUKA|nr:hypothetical protein PAPYR_9533 [Paratrimastix pyriformis]